MSGAELLPIFLKLGGRRVVVVGGGPVAASKIEPLRRAGADLLVVAPEVRPEIAGAGLRVERRPFRPDDLDGAWLAVAAATPEVNRAVAAEAERRRIFVNAVDDPATASAYAGGVVRRGGVTVAVSTDGRAPALAGLLREGIEALLPEQVGTWVERAEALRARWKAEGVAMADRRPLLLRALNELYGEAGTTESSGIRPLTPALSPGGGEGDAFGSPPVGERVEWQRVGEKGKTGGFVSLVGAGPGDPELLTVKAARRLAEADLVLYDALVSGEVLRHAAKAHCFFVGKRAGRPSVQQETINRMLVTAARHGKRVVRLKAGDPFVFGRGGEEALALAEAGVAHEVIPGLTAALAAPALAGIPVTHRGLAAGFTVVSGHAEEAYRPVLEGVAPGRQTLVVLMGLGTRARLVELLRRRGWSPDTPAAALVAASTPEAFTWTGRLADLPEAPLPTAHAPGTLVIGPVVALATSSAGAARTGAAEAR
ncbi:MAG TPA: uroporphyrinogen-III C-methyltransferase [Anaeromyxobacteraceae bacterium]|nr:uroporphyrinogen-III C-methyltransferase [Anaeromyxobacteraceae bacterium]